MEWNRELRGPAGSSSSGFDTRGLLTILCYFDMLQLVQISPPYQPERAKGIAAMLGAQGNADVIRSARAAIDGF